MSRLMKWARGGWPALFLATIACQEYQLTEDPPVPPAKPPGDDGSAVGEPPDWQDCFEGFHGVYSNLSIDHSDVAPRPNDPEASDNPADLDWWDTTSFERYDNNLDFGANWWPVDDGLEGDPAYFAVHWIAWVRAWSDTDLTFTLGSADDAFVEIDHAMVAALPGIHPFEPQTYTVHLDSGQYPLEIRFAHRDGESGFRFRALSGDASICYPEWEQ